MRAVTLPLVLDPCGGAVISRRSILGTLEASNLDVAHLLHSLSGVPDIRSSLNCSSRMFCSAACTLN